MNPPNSSERLKKWKNWWYYYKWYVVCGILVLGVLCNLIGNALGFWSEKPDFQIAYAGKTILTEETLSVLEQTFTSIGDDFNGDGTVFVQINQYISGIPDADAETAYYEYAGEISLIGDISGCESYFFLTDDPDNLQREFQILASPDGSCPKEMDYSTDDKVLSWNDCPLLYESAYNLSDAEQDLSESCRELLSQLYLGRRCFYTDKRTEHFEECNSLWNLIRSSTDSNH